jgi:hypothetical protein
VKASSRLAAVGALAIVASSVTGGTASLQSQSDSFRGYAAPSQEENARITDQEAMQRAIRDAGAQMHLDNDKRLSFGPGGPAYYG